MKMPCDIIIFRKYKCKRFYLLACSAFICNLIWERFMVYSVNIIASCTEGREFALWKVLGWWKEQKSAVCPGSNKGQKHPEFY